VFRIRTRANLLYELRTLKAQVAKLFRENKVLAKEM
jgi:hypothetical protein